MSKVIHKIEFAVPDHFANWYTGPYEQPDYPIGSGCEDSLFSDLLFDCGLWSNDNTGNEPNYPIEEFVPPITEFPEPDYPISSGCEDLFFSDLLFECGLWSKEYSKFIDNEVFGWDLIE